MIAVVAPFCLHPWREGFAAVQHAVPARFPPDSAGMNAATLPISPSSAPLAAPIRAAALRQALIAGAQRVITHRDHLNRINVFPVADGDTGNNLALTLGCVLSGALQRRSAGVGTLLQRVGEEAVDGARGNSGAILAQFFSGLAEAVGARTVLSQGDLALATAAAARSAREAMARPVEGTMLSVISAFAEGLRQAAGAGEPRAWFEAALVQARQALAQTPEQLPVLRQAGVVDAGAQGFVDLLEGIGDFLAGRPPPAPADADPETEFEALHARLHEAGPQVDPAHRWCTECLLVGADLDRPGLQAALAALGADSVVLAGGPRRLRVHAHVALPARMFELLAGFGQVEAGKADDMLAQARTAAAPRALVVVTDSSADLPEGLADALDLHVVPLRLNFGGEDHLDRIGLSTGEFYRRLREESLLPRTSQPPVGDFRRLFEFLLSHHAEVVYVGLSRAVSGTLQAAEAAARRCPPGRVHVVDSANAAGGQALLALAAAEAVRAGAGRDEVLARLAALKPRTLTLALARDVRHAVRGGRIPRWVGAVAGGLRALPVAVLEADGRLHPRSALFGRRRVPERFAALVARRARRVAAGRGWRLIVGHCGVPEDGAALLAALRDRLDPVESWLVETGAAVGAHAGPGTLVASLQPVDP